MSFINRLHSINTPSFISFKYFCCSRTITRLLLLPPVILPILAVFLDSLVFPFPGSMVLLLSGAWKHQEQERLVGQSGLTSHLCAGSRRVSFPSSCFCTLLVLPLRCTRVKFISCPRTSSTTIDDNWQPTAEARGIRRQFLSCSFLLSQNSFSSLMRKCALN